MRKFIFFATALLVLAGCNKKDNALNNAPEGTPFKQGQQVTLTVGTGDNNQAAPRRVAGTDDATNNRIDFAWEEGDKILVKVNGQTAEFTLISGEGTNYGEFAGEMPADGSTFDIQYPITEPDLNAQVYSSTQIDAKQMLFTATGCTLGNDAVLDAQYAMVQLNLYGANKTIGKIVFKSSASPAVSCTLTCPEGGVEIGANSTEATPFYMVVPVGEYKFKADIYNNATIPANMCWLIPSAAQTFTAGNCLNMPAKEVTVVYDGTDNGHAWVNLGLSVVWATTNVGVTTPQGVGTKYYLTGIPSWGDNWRLPTAAEWQELLDHTTEQRLIPPVLSIGSTNDYGWKYSSKSNPEKFIFLPFTDIDYYGYDIYPGYEFGDYWSSTDDGEGGKYYYRSGSEHDDANYVTKAPGWTKTASLNARLVCDVWN